MNSFEVKHPFRAYRLESQGVSHEVPALDIVLSGVGAVVLHWGNTLVRTFRDSGLDHVEVRHGEGDVTGVRDGQNGRLIDMLIDAEFPEFFNPIPDADSLDFCAASYADELDELVAEILDGQ